MIHPHAVQDPALEPGQDQAMSVLEHPRIADAETGQGGDVEEAAIVHIPGRGLPAGQAVSLQLEDGIEALGVGVDGGDRLVERLGDVAAAPEESRQPPAQRGQGLEPVLGTIEVVGLQLGQRV